MLLSLLATKTVIIKFSVFRISLFLSFRIVVLNLDLMANESGELPVMPAPELTKSCDIKIRRYSAEKVSSGNSADKIVPHYLRASTGSCHDFCKFGRNHAFELKDRRSIPNRATRKQQHQSSEESIGAITVSVPRPKLSVDSNQKEKMSKVVLKESVGSKMRVSDVSDTNTRERPTKLVDRQKHVGSEVKVNIKKTSLVKVKPSLLLKSHTSSSTKQEISSSSSSSSSAMQSPLKSTSRKAETQSKLTPEKMKTPSKSTPGKVITSSKSTPDKAKTVSKLIPKEEVNLSKLTALKLKTSVKSTPRVENLLKPTLKKVENPSKSILNIKTSKMVGTSSKLSPLNGKEMKLSAKDITSLNSNHVTRKKTSSMNSSEGEVKLDKRVATSKAVSRKLKTPIKPLSSPRISLRRVASINSKKYWGLKTASHLRNQQTATKVEPEEHNNNNEVEERTLYVIKMESENKTLRSDINANYVDELYLPQLSSPKSSASSISHSSPQEYQAESSEYTTSEFEQDSFSGHHEIECMESEGTLEVVKKGKPNKNGTICLEDKMRKLKFRRGKVVDNQIEKNTPKRLKFRRAKSLVQKANDKDDAERKNFKRKDETSIESNNASISAEKVVLRHQDMQDKKDGQGLLNNVIKEAASKLVETRKSKVKALVGAFETVISLQEKKPSSANNVS